MLHPNRANVSKEDLRAKLAETYKVNKDQVSVFGFRTQYGGGKSTGFALIYDSHEALKKFEPHYRLVRYGIASKIEKPSRQQRMYSLFNRPITYMIMIAQAVSFFWGAQRADFVDTTQASNARTEQRLCGERPRQRVVSRTRQRRSKARKCVLLLVVSGDEANTASGAATLSCLPCGIMIYIAHSEAQ